VRDALAIVGSPATQPAEKVKAMDPAAIPPEAAVHVIFPDATMGDRVLPAQLFALAAVLVTEQDVKPVVAVVKD